MKQTNSSLRRRISFTPIMLTSKSMRPVDRSDYELMRNEQKINRIRKNRTDLSNFVFRDKQQFNRTQKKWERQQEPSFQEGLVEHSEESFRNLARKMTTPAIIKVEFQKELIKSKRNAELKLKQFPECGPHDQLRAQIGKAFSLTNAKTFQQFTKLSKVKLQKRAAQPSEDTSDEQWKRYLNKYYLSIRKVKPLLKNSEAMKMSFPEKVGSVSTIMGKVKKMEQSVQLTEKGKAPFRTHSRRSSAKRSDVDSSLSPESPTKNPEDMISPFVLKRIEQDVALHKVQNRKDFFVFGLSDTASKSTESAQTKSKLDNLWDFIFRINFSNGLYVCIREEDRPLKCYVGFGNNAGIVKGVLRRRYWWTFTDKIQQSSFVWTQLKVSEVFKAQPKSQFKLKQIDRASKKIKGSQLDRTQDSQQSYRPIMCGDDLRQWEKYYQKNTKHEQKGFVGALSKRANALIRYKKIDVLQPTNKLRVHNHLQSNYFLGNKKALFYSMKKYYELKGIDAFTKIPLTFHITQGLEDPQFQKFLDVFLANNELRKVAKDFRNIWIVKPGQLTNRGRGITVCSTLDQIKIRLKGKQKNSNGTARTFIIQKYIERPLLYQRRKFDIRHYMAITCVNGRMKGYWYADGYVRTTSSEYNVKNTKDLFTHLTNDAVQKNGQDYGKFEKGNKVSYSEFRKYLKHQVKAEADFSDDILPKMKELATDTIRATYSRLDSERKENNFELFGLDYMLDEDLNVYLIEVNTNPCLEQSCPLMTKILVPMLDNLFKLCLDPLFPPPVQWPSQRKCLLSQNPLEQNKFSIVFDECEEGPQIRELYKDSFKLDDRMGDISEQEEEYQDEEKEWDEEEEPVKK